MAHKSPSWGRSLDSLLPPLGHFLFLGLFVVSFASRFSFVVHACRLVLVHLLYPNPLSLACSLPLLLMPHLFCCFITFVSSSTHDLLATRPYHHLLTIISCARCTP